MYRKCETLNESKVLSVVHSLTGTHRGTSKGLQVTTFVDSLAAFVITAVTIDVKLQS